ncbi:arginase family protein [Bacillus sp. CGMCC 1.16607]|uniref:arginase family protein n=1 Tax=Bacillus sp. CGMCC 1.16607 TaxID=3351842 RepID=UPI0036338851
MKLTLFGIPSVYGGHVSGPELTPSAIRKSGLVDKFLEKNIEVIDAGNVKLPDCMPRHISPPILNWPSPRMVWDATVNSLQEIYQKDSFLFILGGDCSIIVGTTSFLSNHYGEDLHVVLVDAHVDNFIPKHDMRVGAATMGMWLLSNENMFWEKPATVNYSSFSVIGCHDFSVLPVSLDGIQTVSLQELREEGTKNCIQQFKATLPTNKKIFIHFDVDVIKESEMPAAYFPSADGLTFQECHMVLRELLNDERMIGIELTEFSPLKDPSGELTERLANLLVDVISQRVV